VERLIGAEAVGAWCANRRAAGRDIGIVPTMGAFHEGHLALMRRARVECDTVVVYLFVNPLQFGPGEDLARYPRNIDRDATLAEGVGVDLLFTPTLTDMYPNGYPPKADRLVRPGPAGERFEGSIRPGHFAGMLTVVDRLFAITAPSRAYFGEKDAQQLFLVRQMTAERYPQTEIVACATVREPDGLSMSSRNVYLDPAARSAAACLSRGLFAVREFYGQGLRDPVALRQLMEARVREEPRAALDYAAVIDDATFEELKKPIADGVNARMLVAARLGSTRLIDNLLLN
jgi:pantoate--beta-alanine ligase